MANLTTVELSDFIPEIWAAEALGALKANTVMAGLVNRNYENAIAREGDTVHVPKRGSLTVKNKAANGKVTLQIPDSDAIDVVLNKHKEVSFLVEDVARAQANQDVIAGYIQDGIIAIGHEVDADLLGLHSGLTATAVNALAGIDADKIVDARRVMNAALVPLQQRYCVWHEDAEAEILKVEKLTSSNWVQDAGAAIKEAYIGRRYGFDHLMDQQVVVADAACQNLAFQRDAFTLVTRPLPAIPDGLGARSTVMVEDNIAIRVIWSYNPDYLGVQVTLDILYGVGVLQPTFGVVIQSTEVA